MIENINTEILESEPLTMTTKETVQCLGSSPSTITRLKSKGILTPVKWKGVNYYRKSDVKDYLRESGVFDLVYQNR
ncbi:MAG: helix-turn-helix domain-containing protein [Rhodothermales bacterium]|nr:helix-turn-helix domain-containing protein [Rhodothermales bacterium]MBO6778689.1 helix-turn-helix domain-containing protein [Rhodothermales bacterium]